MEISSSQTWLKESVLASNYTFPEILPPPIFDIRSLMRTLSNDFCDINPDLFFKDVLLVGIQHVLATTVDMLAIMKEFGLRNAVIGGKKYSTHLDSARRIQDLGFTYIPDCDQLGYGRFGASMNEVVYKIWHTVLEKLELKKYRLMIILDDGADLLRATPGAFFTSINSLSIKNRPDMIIGIEQTRGGANRPTFNGFPFPVINVAGAFVKTAIEYPHVANLVARRLHKLIQTDIAPEIKRKPLIGVIGYGTMGQAITKKMLDSGFEVIVFDKDKTKINSESLAIYYDNSAILIANADVVIGCTGKDITKKKANLSAFLYSRQKKWLISTSSKDREFNTLLRVIQSEVKGLGYAPDPFRTIQYENHAAGVIDILRGGFPINFDNEAHSIPPERIWPTRAALLLACLSTIKMQQNYEKNYSLDINTFMLSPKAQLLIIKKYLELNPNDTSLAKLSGLPDNLLLSHIIQHSDGTVSNSLK